MKRRAVKEYIVIGLGRFGSSVAMQLEANGCRVLAVDRNENKVRQIAEHVTLAMRVDVSDEDALSELGGRNFDGAIIAIGHSLEASVLASIWAREQNIGQVIAKAYDETHGKILAKLGVDSVVYPEVEMGVHLANNLVFNNLFDAIELTAEYSIADIDVPESWEGKSLRELRLRERDGVNVVGVKHNGELQISPPADEPARRGSVFVLLGKNSTLEKIANEASGVKAR